ncbi:MAG: hypothetical protein J6B89_02765 [Bacilli bacterium]|nr:hypothetical protein [Bacilli bacterium]
MKKENKKINQQDNSSLKSGLFFAFYIVFFLVVVFLLRTGYKENNSKVTATNSGYGYSFKLTRLENKNYYFIYTEELDTNTTIYEGERFANTSKYKKSGSIIQEYIEDSQEIRYKNPNTLTWEKCDNPMIFNKFTNSNNIKRLLTHGTYISKTMYVSNKDTAYNYEISTSTIAKLFDKVEIDIDDKPNTMSIILDETGKIKEIKYDLTSYYQYKNQNTSSYKISLKYSKYGEIKEIELP